MLKKLSLILLGLVLGSQMALAQVTTATISGVVQDSTGAVIPGVTVTVRNVDTGIARTVTSGVEGRYQASNLSLGNYEVQAQTQGFQTEVRTGLVLTVGREAIVNFQLQVGAVTQTVEVTGEAPLVETTGSSVAGFVETEQILSLPLNGRSFDNLILLQPGTALSKMRSGGNLQGGFTQKISIKGARPESNSFLLDGTDVAGPSNDIPGSVGGQSLGVDTVREVRIETSGFSAQYGRSAGGVVNVVSKSGTNQFHGTVFEFNRNENMDATKWEDNVFCTDPTRAADECEPSFVRNQFGFSAGGPIIRDKTFFFGSYEALRERVGRTSTGSVPDLDARMGILDGEFIGVNSKSEPYLDLFPLPNAGPTGADGAAFFITRRSTVIDEDFFTVKVDHNFSESDNIFVRYTFDEGFRSVPEELPVFNNTNQNRNQYATLAETHIFSPTLLNNFRLGFNRSNRGNFNFSALDDATAAALEFVPGVPLFSKGAELEIDDLSTIGCSNCPRVWTWNLFEASDDVSYTRGNHSLKFGTLFKWMLFVQDEGKSTGGEYSLDGVEQLLLGEADGFRAALPGTVSNTASRYNYVSWYVQDDIRVSSRLNVNFGLRHEFYTGPRERTDRWCHLPTLDDTEMICGKEAGPLWDTSELSLKNFAPRFGFAYDVRGDGRTSVRGGWGIYYDVMSVLWWQSPFSGSFPAFSDGQLGDEAPDGSPTPFPDAFRFLGRGNIQNTVLGVWGGHATPSSQQWNLEIQQQIGRDAVFKIGYLGSVGRHLWTRANENTKLPTILSDGRQCYNFTRNPQTRARENNEFCPDGSLDRRNPVIGDTRRIKTMTNSNYNALVLGFQKRLSRTWIITAGSRC